jgi:membrane-associated protease RseP (regulator of RpoE activity)
MLVTLLFIYLVIFVCAVVHEYGHFREFRRIGIRTVEVGLGLPIGFPLLSFMWRGITWSVYPLMVGAFVKPDRKQLSATAHQAARDGNELFFDELLNAFAGGIRWNIYLSVVTFVLALCLQPRILKLMMVNSIVFWHGVICLTLLLSCLHRRFFSRWGVPIIGLLMLIGQIVLAALRPNMFHGLFENADTMKPMVQSGIVLKPYLLLIFVSTMSLLLATSNCLPLVPLDGGQIMALRLHDYEWIPKGFIRSFTTVGMYLVAFLLILPFLLDAAWLTHLRH